MNTISLVYFGAGLGIGLAMSALILFLRRRDFIIQDAQQDAMKLQFESLSQNTLQQSIEHLLTLNEQQYQKHAQNQSQNLGEKKILIDDNLKRMKSELDKVHETVRNLEKDREKKFGELSETLKNSNEQVNQLLASTQNLTQALKHSHSRGQCGERMAEDILRFSGLIEGVNYSKQRAQSSSDLSRNIPDFTFFLPKNMKLNMDVKFPFAHYLSYLDAENDEIKESEKKVFFKDVKARIKEVNSRSYITEETLDYVLVFIPNEQIYSFINQESQELIKDALAQKVVLCSPLTLYAMLSVIRQSIENFHMDQRAKDILQLLNRFSMQWDKFKESMSKLGRGIQSVQNEFNQLSSTRTNQLEKPLRDIEILKQSSDAEISKSSIETPGNAIHYDNSVATLIDRAH
mgnify:CR=1 FL=1